MLVPQTHNLAATYPPALKVPEVSTIPKAWLDKLEAVKGQIANVPVSTPVNSTDSNAVTYPNNTAAYLESKDVCAYTTGCVTADIRDGPHGTFMVSINCVSSGLQSLTCLDHL